jgi:hypothetical protein
VGKGGGAKSKQRDELELFYCILVFIFNAGLVLWKLQDESRGYRYILIEQQNRHII